jgi:hypothetical protein
MSIVRAKCDNGRITVASIKQNGITAASIHIALTLN